MSDKPDCFVGDNRETDLGKVVDITLIQVRLPPVSLIFSYLSSDAIVWKGGLLNE